MEENQQKSNGGNGKGNRRPRGHRPPKDNYTPPYAPEVLATPLASLGIGDNTLQVLAAAHITTVGDVARRRAADMYRVQNFGKRNLAELGRALATVGADFRPAEAPASQPAGQPQRQPEQPKGQNNARDRGDRNKNAAPAAKPNGNGGASRGEGQGNQRPDRNKQQDRAAAKNGQPRPPQNASNAAQTNNNGGAPRGEGQGKNKRKDKGNPQFDPNLTLDKIFPKPKFVRSKRIEPETDRFVKFQRGGKWGFKDKNGQEVIPPIYDEVFNFKEDMACVERKQLFGYINRENELVIPYRFETASSFSEGYACVGDEVKCGFIDKQGDIVVPFVYDACTAVVDGRSHVKKEGKWGTLILATNEIIWS